MTSPQVESYQKKIRYFIFLGSVFSNAQRILQELSIDPNLTSEQKLAALRNNQLAYKLACIEEYDSIVLYLKLLADIARQQPNLTQRIFDQCLASTGTESFAYTLARDCQFGLRDYLALLDTLLQQGLSAPSVFALLRSHTRFSTRLGYHFAATHQIDSLPRYIRLLQRLLAYHITAEEMSDFLHLADSKGKTISDLLSLQAYPSFLELLHQLLGEGLPPAKILVFLRKPLANEENFSQLLLKAPRDPVALKAFFSLLQGLLQYGLSPVCLVKFLSITTAQNFTLGYLLRAHQSPEALSYYQTLLASLRSQSVCETALDLLQQADTRGNSVAQLIQATCQFGQDPNLLLTLIDQGYLTTKDLKALITFKQLLRDYIVQLPDTPDHRLLLDRCFTKNAALYQFFTLPRYVTVTESTRSLQKLAAFRARLDAPAGSAKPPNRVHPQPLSSQQQAAPTWVELTPVIRTRPMSAPH